MVDGGVLSCVPQFGLRLSPFDQCVPSPVMDGHVYFILCT